MSVLESDGTSTPVTACPACGYQMDHATALKGTHAPATDDFSLCLMCAAVLRFNCDLTVREASADELALLELDMYEEIQAARSAILQMHSTRGAR